VGYVRLVRLSRGCSGRVTPAPEPCTLSLHDALPISTTRCRKAASDGAFGSSRSGTFGRANTCPTTPNSPGSVSMAKQSPWKARKDRKSTRLNSSHVKISYADVCLKKKLHFLGIVLDLSQPVVALDPHADSRDRELGEGHVVDVHRLIVSRDELTLLSFMCVGGRSV